MKPRAGRNILVASFVVVALLGASALVRAPSPPEGKAFSPSAEQLSETTEGASAADVRAGEPSASRTFAEREREEDSVLAILKDVGEAAYPRFGLRLEDFQMIKGAGFDIIEGNFDSCAEDDDVRFFLDSAADAGLKVILNAGAGEAEWGYPCDGDFDPGMKPTWQREEVRAWVEKWKRHPAVFAWDTANEDGGTFPFSTGGISPARAWETKYALTVEQLREAYRDVRLFDPSHPVMIRMNGWYFYDYEENFFRPGNAFGNDVADIVMVNAYSNVDDYYADFVTTVLARATRAMHAIDPDIRVIPALGVWEEPPTWVKPTRFQLTNDFNQARKTADLLGVAFFKYGARSGSDWYLPDAARGSPELWQAIRELIE